MKSNSSPKKEEQASLLGKRSPPEDSISENELKDLIQKGANGEDVEDKDDGEDSVSDKSDAEGAFTKDDVEPEWVCLRGVERFDQERNVLRMLQRVFAEDKFHYVKISKPRKKNLSFIKFETTIERDRFIKAVSAKKFSKKQKKLKVKPAFKGDKQLNQGVLVEVLDNQNSVQHQQQQRQNVVKVATQEDIQKELDIPLEERVCPLWKTPYNEQVDLKKKDFADIIANIQKRAKDAVKSEPQQPPQWITQTPIISEFIECDEQFRFCYRNKTELTIGLNHLGEPKVGYNRTNFEKGIAFIDDSDKNAVASKESIVLAKLLEQFIIKSGLPVYDRFLHVGFWRYFVIRQSYKTKEILLNIVIKSSTVTDPAQLQAIKDDLVKEFSVENLPSTFDYKITSIGLQHYEQSSDSIPQDGEIEIIFGASTYKEVILDKTFNISANAFLQVNTPQCEKLYKLIGSLTGELNERTIFLDICSGIGTIGICLATSAKEVIGIEMVESACEDAKINIEQNGIKNYRVVCSKVEDVINEIVKPLAGLYKIIGVVDPPRPGLHANVVKALRTCRGLDHLVYVACNPPAITDNLLALCLPESKRRRAPGFHITKYFGCDLFPQTKHFEAIFYLERYPNYIKEI